MSTCTFWYGDSDGAMSSRTSTLKLGTAQALEASALSCGLGSSLDMDLFVLAQAQITTPWYPTSKRHANPEVGP